MRCPGRETGNLLTQGLFTREDVLIKFNIIGAKLRDVGERCRHGAKPMSAGPTQGADPSVRGRLH